MVKTVIGIIKYLIQWFKANKKEILTDALVTIGLSAIAVGLWYFDFRLSLIVTGALLTGIGIVLAYSN